MPSQPIPEASSAPAPPMRIEPGDGPRPVESGGGEPDTETSVPESDQAAPRRKRRGLLVGGLALVLVIVVGVALALPYVSNRLGLPWAPNRPKGDSPQPAGVALSLHGPDTSAPTPTNSGVSAALSSLAGNAALGTFTGIVIDPATNSVLWDHNSSQLLTPASVTKVLTSSAALLKVDHALQLSTKVVAGSSPDTAVLVAGGDLTLSSLPAGKENLYPGAAHLDDLVAQVKRASGGQIKKVQIDLSAFTGPTTGPGWDPTDAPSTYAAPVVPAMLDGGRSNPIDDHSMRVANPALTLLQTFAQRLGASVASTSTTTAPRGAKVLGEVRSAPLTELVDAALQLSDNDLAEVIGRQTAIASGKPASFAGATEATMEVLAQNGFDVSSVNINDNSGLSTMNKVSARLLAQLLAVAAAPDGKDPRTAKLRPLLEGLPVAGGSGTLSDRYTDGAAALGKGWVRAKTGTISSMGVNTLAGVVLDKDGHVLVFALMSNRSNTDTGRQSLDAVAAALRGCGCR
ncbi:D-alanyl-D-alanine carboxypeptidase/D-alanyl-D-alanine-endopeptidase [Amycolatopsis cynarae]|uniref:D-alanyl-D-alanine carboxypeptidase/D-alanyl-D-alanine-endopeptidase n=1 Tax=Amycolatopsis cynarae TaxID=2995223 RepID=A0ABY7B1B9_9PSEU|nr:D-alanyl-D-alanine carboxypeptidase/D-alanyl-D-alanine-endopeptidase [Amycolatopsis sp. HUAS 11-8]WAL66101.1 D-alanyl-D-alanine carboxypeptidase/D-alanyl-D-alanine-endopeptidase [Amycolatopsis sp. HUAS 11-8]